MRIRSFRSPDRSRSTWTKQPISEEEKDLIRARVTEQYFYHLTSTYGLDSLDKIDAIMKHQEHKCACCDSPIGWGTFVVHHVHSQEQYHPSMTKAPPTCLLCQGSCNRRLTGFEEPYLANIEEYMTGDFSNYDANARAMSYETFEIYVKRNRSSFSRVA